MLPSLCLASPRSSNAGASLSVARGRADAKAKGVKFGRKPKLTPRQQRAAIQRRDRGEREPEYDFTPYRLSQRLSR